MMMIPEQLSVLLFIVSISKITLGNPIKSPIIVTLKGKSVTRL